MTSGDALMFAATAPQLLATDPLRTPVTPPDQAHQPGVRVVGLSYWDVAQVREFREWRRHPGREKALQSRSRCAVTPSETLCGVHALRLLGFAPHHIDSALVNDGTS
jgi:hypothetical protein